MTNLSENMTRLPILGEDQQMYCWHLCTTVVVLISPGFSSDNSSSSERNTQSPVSRPRTMTWLGPYMLTWLAPPDDVADTWRGRHLLTWLPLWVPHYDVVVTVAVYSCGPQLSISQADVTLNNCYVCLINCYSISLTYCFWVCYTWYNKYYIR